MTNEHMAHDRHHHRVDRNPPTQADIAVIERQYRLLVERAVDALAQAAGEYDDHLLAEAARELAEDHRVTRHAIHALTI